MTTEPAAEESTETALVIRVPAGGDANGLRPTVGAPVAPPLRSQSEPGEPAETPGDLGWIARGVAKVGKPRTVQARAAVPGALSLPRPRPNRLIRLGQPAMPFPRRVFPPATDDTQGHPERPADGPSDVRDPEVDLDPRGAGAETEAAPPKDRSGAVRKKSRLCRAALPAVAAVLAAFVAGTGYLAATDRSPADLGRWGAVADNPSTEAAAPATSAAGTPVERPAGDPFGSVAAAPSGVPTRLRIGAVKIDTSLETLRIGGDGALQPPKTFAKAGWYADGTAPGDNGPAVIAGHVDSKAGPAVFYRLRELTAGDKIDVVRGGATVSFTVTAIRWYPKSEFPTDEVYGPTPDRQLRLITCGGVFDHSLRSYRDNLVVYAVAG